MQTFTVVRAMLRLAVFSLFLAAGCGSDAACDYALGTEGCSGGTLTVDVVGAGTGSGNVTGDGIDCDLPNAGAHTGACDESYPLTGGGNVLLTAHAEAGSVFVRWTSGCSRIEGAGGVLCYIDFSGVATYTSTVTAQFDLAPAGGDNTVMFYNAASVAAYLVGPSETPGPGNLVESHGPARNIAIPTTVGSQATFRAYLNPTTVAATITCLVTASAWQNSTHPLVAFNNSEGNFLTCSDGLVAP